MREMKKLGELGDVFIGLTYKPEDVVDEDGTIVLRSSNIQDGKLDFGDIVRVSCNIRDKLWVKENDILMCSRNGSAKLVGKTALISNLQEDMTFGAFMTIIRTPYNGYLQYFFKSPMFRRQLNSSATTTINQITRSMLDNIDVPVFDNDTADNIKAILGKCEKIIQERKVEINALDDLIKARFVEMFGNKGENPNGYEEDTLGNLYKFQYGKGNNIPEDKGEYPCYGSNGIVGHHTEYNNEDSPIIGHIGAYAGIVNWGAGKHYVTYNGVMCKLKTDRVNPTYGFHLLQQQDFNRVATKGGGQPFVSYGDLEAPIVVVPPIEVQEAYATFADKVDKSKVAVQKSLDETQQLFDSLMQKYFG